jgi:hypothetical protein
MPWPKCGNFCLLNKNGKKISVVNVNGKTSGDFFV